MQTMYPGMPNSPQTELAADITADDTTIPLVDASKLPPAPNLAVIGSDEMAETVLYTGIDGNNLTGVTRGFQGVAKAWNAGTKVARNFTAYDWDSARQNVEELAGDIADVQGDVAELQNEVSDLTGDIASIRTDIGDMSTVPTAAKNAAGAITELFTSVGSGKEMLAAAITDKGVPTSPTDTFATMAANIGAIETGGPWFGDWAAYTPVYNISGTTQNVPPQSWHTFVNITGTGFLKWCRAYHDSSYAMSPKVRITIDGTEKVFDVHLYFLRAVGNEVGVELPFFESLKIEVYNSDTLTTPLGCDYLYFLQNASPDPNVNSLMQQSVVTTTYLAQQSTSLIDVVNMSGSGYLLEVCFWGYYNTASGTIYGDIAIDGVTKMSDRRLWSIGGGYKLDKIVGPIRFGSSLRVRVRSDNLGTVPLCLVRYSLD